MSESTKDDAAKKAEEKKIEEQLLGSRSVGSRTEENKPPEQAEIDNAQRVLHNGPDASTGPQDGAAAKKAEKKATARRKKDDEDGEQNADAPAQYDDGDNGWGGVPVQMRNQD